MNKRDTFFDTNILLYLLSADSAKADRAEALLEDGGCISVQVLNEFSAVAARKLKMDWTEIREALALIRAVCTVEPVTIETHDRALLLIERYGFSLYDALIVASALLAGCGTLVSEDMQHGQVIDRQLTVRNPLLCGEEIIITRRGRPIAKIVKVSRLREPTAVQLQAWKRIKSSARNLGIGKLVRDELHARAKHHA